MERLLHTTQNTAVMQRAAMLIGLAVLGAALGQAAAQNYPAGMAVPLAVPLAMPLAAPEEQQKSTQQLNKVEDPYQDGDPIRDPGFRKEYLHDDGTINERVLLMIQKYSPMSGGAMPVAMGIFLFLLIVALMSWTWIKSQNCLEPRDNDNTWRLWYSRRQRNMSKMDAQGV